MRKIVLLSLLGFFQYVNAQTDSVYAPVKLSQTDITVLFSFYTQDGNHSAVTGGTGTELLQVYAPEIMLAHTMDSTHQILFNIGVDVISSASTDNIDFIISSASKKDMRAHSLLGYGYTDYKTGLEVGGSFAFSVESDYTSEGVALWLNWRDKNKMQELGLNFEMFFDDLRWGLVDPLYKKPVKLVYPKELRDTAWFTNYRRTSFNASVSYNRVLSRRMNLSITTGFSYQTGLLSTPFHRVYFNDSISERVENLPPKRYKIPVSAGLNVFISKRWILRNYYRFYWDNYGIIANTISMESAIKISAVVTLSPLLRFYHQAASGYFKPYMQHSTTQAFYTSDYDLSSFYSIQPGIGLRIAPHHIFKNSKGASHKHFAFNEFGLRYSYYHRSDGLRAHIISTVFDFQNTRSKPKVGKL